MKPHYKIAEIGYNSENASPYRVVITGYAPGSASFETHTINFYTIAGALSYINTLVADSQDEYKARIERKL